MRQGKKRTPSGENSVTRYTIRQKAVLSSAARNFSLMHPYLMTRIRDDRGSLSPTELVPRIRTPLAGLLDQALSPPSQCLNCSYSCFILSSPNSRVCAKIEVPAMLQGAATA